MSRCVWIIQKIAAGRSPTGGLLTAALRQLGQPYEEVAAVPFSDELPPMPRGWLYSSKIH